MIYRQDESSMLNQISKELGYERAVCAGKKIVVKVLFQKAE